MKIFGVFLLILICVGTAYLYGKHESTTINVIDITMDAELNKAMEYHGVQKFQFDGNWYFIRNGSRCVVFSNQYREWRRKQDA